MTDDQQAQDPATGDPAAVPPAAPQPVEGSGWVQPAPAASAPVEGSGWVQPAAPPVAAGPAWGQPPASPPVEGSGWVQPPTQPPAAAGPAWGQPQAPAAPPAAAGPAWGQPQAPAAPPAAAGPAWGQPPAAPPTAAAPAPTGWAQPAPTPGWVQPVVNQQGSVTILARLAGLFLVLLGIFWGFIGVVLIIGGSTFKSILDNFGPLSTNASDVDTAGNVIGGVFVGIGIVMLVLAIVEVLGGFGTIMGKTWGRIIGILYSLVFGAFLLLGLSGASKTASVSNADTGGGIIFLLVMFLLYLYALVVLIIRWRGRAHA